MTENTTTTEAPKRRRSSTRKLSIHEAIPKIIGELPEIGKGSRMESGPAKYDYRAIDDIIPHLKTLMAKHGVYPVCRYELVKDEPFTTTNGSLQQRVVLKGTFRFVAADGSRTRKITMYGEARDSGDKAFNKAETAAYKYALIETFVIGGDDPDHTPSSATQRGTSRRPVGVPGQPLPVGADMPEGGPWALTDERVLVYADTSNYAALSALSDALVAAGVKDMVREWADREGIALNRGHDEPGLARVVEYAEGLLEAAAQDAAEGPAVPLDPDSPSPVDELRAKLADKGIALPDDIATAPEGGES